MDPENVPIHVDILEDNKYGPAVPGVDILQSLTDFAGNCFLTDGLERGKGEYATFKTDPGVCDVSDKLTDYPYNQGIQTVSVPSDIVPKVRILLREFHLVNEKANQFFQDRSARAVELLDTPDTTQNTKYSIRSEYIDRRHAAEQSNAISLLIMAVVTIFTLFTAGYIIIVKGMPKENWEYAALLSPIIVFLAVVTAGYILIPGYQISLRT